MASLVFPSGKEEIGEKSMDIGEGQRLVFRKDTGGFVQLGSERREETIHHCCAALICSHEYD